MLEVTPGAVGHATRHATRHGTRHALCYSDLPSREPKTSFLIVVGKPEALISRLV